MQNVVKTFLCLPAFLAIGCATVNNVAKAEHAVTQTKPAPACQFSAEDSAWVKRAISAWHDVNRTITQVADVGVFDVIFFDAKCQRMSSDALQKTDNVIWTSELHNGTVQFPNGDEMPPIVNSFTMSTAEGQTFFVMSVPSIWRDGGVTSPIGLETFMVPVMLHEAMHAIQSPTYGKQIDALIKKHNLPDSFNDDSVQAIFEDNKAFSASVLAEVDLLMQAAQATTDSDARRLARQARDMLKNRYQTWMIGDAEKYRAIDDVWLTMEGSGQWLGYSWLSSANGGRLTKAEAIDAFGLRGKWWSQKLGFALFMALDRLADNWQADAFGNGNRTVLALLDDALLEEK